MSKEELNAELKAMRSASEAIRSSKEEVRSFLRKHGYITKSGKLTKRYGG